MRLVLLTPFLLASCGDPGEATDKALAEARAAEAGRIECAVEGASDFQRACGVERLSGPEGVILLLRHPSGGFRRVVVTTDGRGVAAADGADPATVSLRADDRIEVEIAADRYRLPARVKGQ